MRFFTFCVLFFFSISIFSQTTSACDSAYAGNNQQACSDSVLLLGNGPLNGTGSWSCLTPSVIIFNPGSDSTEATGLAVGQNFFIWTISGGGCPTVSDTVVYIVDSIPSRPYAGLDQQVCGNSATLTGNQLAVGTGMWVVTAGSGTISNPYASTTSVSNLGQGQNTIRWTSSAGSCVRIDDVVVSGFGLPTASSAGPDQTICDTSFFLSANTPFVGSGFWTLIDGVGKIFKPNFANTSVDSAFFGDTLVFVWNISSGPCPSSADTVMVIINMPPSVPQAGNDQVLCSAFGILSASPVSVGTGEWSLITGGSVISDTLSNTTAVSNISPGNNIFVWTTSNGVCPIKTDTVIFTNSENPNASAGLDQNLCTLNTNMDADPVVSATGTWSLLSGAGNVLQLNSNQSLVSNLGIGQNIFIWTVSNGICPSKSDTVILTVFAPSTIAFAGPDLVVCGNSANLSASGAVNGTGTWSVVSGNGVFSFPNNGSTLVSGLNSGSNVFSWTIVNGVCPPSSDTIVVISLGGVSNAFAGNDTTICSDSIVLNPVQPISGTGTWTTLTIGPVITNSSGNALASGLVAGQNIFVWTVSGAGQCPSSSDSIVVSRDLPPSIANAGQDLFTSDVEMSLGANAPVIGTGLWSVVDNNGNIASSTTPNSIFSVSQTGDYVLVWTISNGVCPSSSDTVNISVVFEQIPEVITPNGDGKNDVFKINPLLFSNNVELFVYNRWGVQVYEDKDYKHDFSGVGLVDDSYFYEVRLNGVLKFKGYLLIKRK